MARCKYSKQGANDFYDEHHEEYAPAKEEAFLKLVEAMAETYLCSVDLDEHNPSVVDFADSMDEEFKFPEIGDWLASEYESELGDCADQAYELEKDRRMGL